MAKKRRSRKNPYKKSAYQGTKSSRIADKNRRKRIKNQRKLRKLEIDIQNLELTAYEPAKTTIRKRDRVLKRLKSLQNASNYERNLENAQRPGRSLHDDQHTRKVIVCHKRKERRTILFSTKKAGRGRRTDADRRFTEDSKVRC